MPPRGVKPVALAVDGLLVHREALALYANGFNAYPAGFSFALTSVRDHPYPRDVRAPDFRPANPFGSRRPRGEPGSREELLSVLRVGVRFTDGGSVFAANHGAWRGVDHPLEPPTITSYSGSGTESEWVERFWVWGVPAGGDVELAYSWPAEDVPDSSLLIDGDALREAAARAVTLWGEPGDEESTV
jgi:hypothetical protein